MKIMKSFEISFIFLFLIAVSVCVGAADQATGKKIVLKTGHVYSTDHPVNKAFEFFDKRIRELSGGRISLDIYANSILGGEKDVLEQLMIGEITMDIAPPSLLSGKYSAAMIEELPFLWGSMDHWCAAREGEYGKAMQKRIYDKEGLIVLAAWPIGFRHFTNNIRPIVKPEDLKGMKMRSAESIIRLKMFEVLGANAVAMPFNELFTALQQGVIDGQENPLSTIDSACLYEVQKYLSLSGHIFTGYDLVMTKKFWNSLKSEEQQWIIKAIGEATALERKLILEREDSYLQKLKKFLVVNEVDRDAFIKAVQPVYDFYIDKYGNEDMIKMAKDVATKK